MDTESSEVHKAIHEGTEVYLNGKLLGNGEIEYEVETPYEEVRSGEWGPEILTRPTKRTFRITIPEGARAPQGDWIIKQYAPGGNVKERAFSNQEEARQTMEILRGFDIEGRFELVCRPKVEDVVVTSYRNEPEEGGDTQSVSGFDREKVYRDDSGDTWTYLCEPGDRSPGWYFQEEEGGPHYGPFPAPISGPHEEVEDEEEAISEAWDLLKSKRYLDRYGCVWEYRYHQGSDRPAWHYRMKGDRDWSSRGFYVPVAGPWTEYEGEA